MEFQYNSINRGGYSIMEQIAKEGYDPLEYIRFYNLRNYDRLNSSVAMDDATKSSGVGYEEARVGYEQKYHGKVADADEETPQDSHHRPSELTRMLASGGDDQKSKDPAYFEKAYQQYQSQAEALPDYDGLGRSGRWDSVSECYMLNGEDIRNVPWKSGTLLEMDAFVSEELYVHSKVG